MLVTIYRKGKVVRTHYSDEMLAVNLYFTSAGLSVFRYLLFAVRHSHILVSGIQGFTSSLNVLYEVDHVLSSRDVHFFSQPVATTFHSPYGDIEQVGYFFGGEIHFQVGT